MPDNLPVVSEASSDSADPATLLLLLLLRRTLNLKPCCSGELELPGEDRSRLSGQHGGGGGSGSGGLGGLFSRSKVGRPASANLQDLLAADHGEDCSTRRSSAAYTNVEAANAGGIVNSLQKCVMEGGSRANLHGRFVCHCLIVSRRSSILAAEHASPDQGARE